MAQKPAELNFQRKKVIIGPAYLIEVSNCIDLLNHFYEQEGLGSLSDEYRNLLITSFNTLNQSMELYSKSGQADANSMVQASVIKCRSQLQTFCLEKMSMLLGRESQDLGKILLKVANQYRLNMQDFQKVLIAERKRRLHEEEDHKNRMIERLKEELINKKQYIEQIKERLKEVENENSKMYQKMISNAKYASEKALSPKKSTISPEFTSKLKTEISQISARKPLTAKQVEQIILEIMQTKQKQDSIKSKHTNLKNYLKTYFRFKFGMKDLAQQVEIKFREALEEHAHGEEKNIFVLFIKMMDEQCEEQYFWEQRAFYDKIARIVKRYLNEKDSIPIDDLDRLYNTKIVDQRADINLNERDVQYILINTYKTSEVESLQLIINEILLPKLHEDSGNANEPVYLPSKKLINQILNYELNRHLLKIEDVVRVIHDVDSGRGFLNLEDIEAVVIRLKIPEEKIAMNLQLLGDLESRFLTYSEAIEIVEKIRKTKLKKK